MSKTFFVLSVGRSGSTSLTRSFSYAKNAKLFHEPIGGTNPYLKGVAENQKLNHPFTVKEIFEGFRKKAVDAVLDSGLIYGELTPMLGYVSQGMLESYPDSKVIWLLRNPLTWVRSACHANFQDGEFKKVCHHWFDLTMHLASGYYGATKQNRCMVKLEDLTTKRKYDLYKWLGLEPVHDGAKEWMEKEFNEHKYLGPKWCPHPDNWREDIEWKHYNTYIEPLLQDVLTAYQTEAFGC